MYLFIKLFQRVVFNVSDGGYDMGGKHSDCAFNSRLVLWFAYSCRGYKSAVIFCEFTVSTVDFICMDMRIEP